METAVKLAGQDFCKAAPEPFTWEHGPTKRLVSSWPGAADFTSHPWPTTATPQTSNGVCRIASCQSSLPNRPSHHCRTFEAPQAPSFRSQYPVFPLGMPHRETAWGYGNAQFGGCTDTKRNTPVQDWKDVLFCALAYEIATEDWRQAEARCPLQPFAVDEQE